MGKMITVAICKRFPITTKSVPLCVYSIDPKYGESKTYFALCYICFTFGYPLSSFEFPLHFCHVTPDWSALLKVSLPFEPYISPFSLYHIFYTNKATVIKFTE